MENPCYKTLVPRNLRMTPMACFYCGAPDSHFQETERLFGLKHCAMHKAAAIRDCRAYLHTTKTVKMKDACAHPIVGQLMTLVKGLVGFPVLRSSGVYQDGWTLNTSKFAYNTNLVCTDEWMIPVINLKEDTTKHIPISNFKTTHPEFTETIDAAVFCLIDGIYTREYEEVQSLLEMPEEYPDVPFVESIVFEGREGRVMMPQPKEEPEENPS
jgi:hypothetical protein